MAAMSRGPVPKLRAPKKFKGGTASSRRHVFEGFSQRIAKLKIEPVRRGRNTILDDAELNTAFSYFKDSFAEWRELNISDVFTRFARQLAPLCESLPQILHHSDRIIELLVEYIEKGDKFSEEPLLNLLTHLAHDLDERFEKYFERVVRTVTQLAATHEDVEVIEWSFTCLAWLFKYLFKLLVPDLRPVFDLMAPLLGKEHQKLFVSRFAAESLSFLIRKAGARHHRDPAPLKLILGHLSKQLKELQGSGKDSEFQQGLMFLLTDSLKGVQRGLHSSAVAIFQEMLLQTYERQYIQLQNPPFEHVLIGVVTAVIHHSDAENFKALADVVLAQINSTSADLRYLGLSSRILFVICGVRRGSRIEDWKATLHSLGLLFDSANGTPQLDVADAWDLLSTISIVFQYCTLDSAIPRVQLLEKLSSHQWEKYFLSFCNLFAELGEERFSTLLLPYFKKFITFKAHEHDAELCVVLPQLYRSGAIPLGSIVPSPSWQEVIMEKFGDLTDTAWPEIDMEQTAYICNSLLEVISGMSISQETTNEICDSLRNAFHSAIEAKKDEDVHLYDKIGVGHGLTFSVQHANSQTALSNPWPSLCKVSLIYGQYPSFWQAMLSLAEKEKANLDCEGPHMNSLRQALMRCLGSPSHDMRLAALSLLEIITAKDKDAHNIISIAGIIEQTPLSLETQRSVSMRIGQIAKMYPDVCADEWVAEAIPTYCFGLLHVRLASVWNDACQALNAICESKEGEAQVSKTAFEWLGYPDQKFDDSASVPTENGTPRRHVSEFECTNIMQLEKKIMSSRDSVENVNERLKKTFESQYAPIPFITAFSRTQALRVLDALPHVAEKRSRSLVPILLDWALDERAPAGEDASEDTPEQPQNRWSRKDQKAMLTVFSKFNNPKVLFRSGDVYEALLALLSNGDVDIQKAALKALMTWKDAAVVKYQEDLLNILDDARFRDEISVFVSQDKIQEDHVEHVLPVMLRLLYGRIIAGKRGLESKRKAVFVAVKNRFGETAIRQFLSIALGSLSGIDLLEKAELDEQTLSKDLANPRKQLGMLNMLEDMLSTFKSTFTPFTSTVVHPVLYCLIRASREIMKAVDTKESEAEGTEAIKLSLLKTVRQRALQTLNVLFETSPEFEWKPLAAVVVEELVNPRLQQFPIETAQSVSALLRLFAAWSKSPRTAPFLVEFNRDIIVKVVECLAVPSAKDEVKRFVLDDIVQNLISLVANEDKSTNTEAKILRNRIHTDVLQPYSNMILGRVGSLLKGSPSKEVLESGVQTVAQLAPHVVGSAETRSMIEISTFLLRQPSRRVNPRTKLSLLRILHEFIPRCDGKDQDELFGSIYDAICPMFSFVQDRTSRTVLCNVIQDLSDNNEELVLIAQLCHDLNSFSSRRLDEPDFERRSNAFNTINEEQFRSYSLNQWKPMVYNMLYFIKDNEELSIRVNASLSLRRFIEVSTLGVDFKDFIASAILPSMQSGMRETSELVRVEFLAVLAQLVKVYHDWPSVADMRVLLSDDEEASFFGNVLHIQGHRRLRALRRLASHATQLQSGNIYHILVPLLEHFIFDKAEDEAASNLAGEAIRTVSALAEWLEWPQFRSLLKRTIGYLTSKEDMQKTIIKLLVGLMDSLKQAGQAKGYISTTPSEEKIETSTVEDGDKDAMDVDKPASTLSKTLPQKEKLTADLANNIIPDLIEFLHKKDEATVSLRVPVAVAVTKVLLVLPPQEIEARLPAVLLDICHILKSRAPESRDMSRNTLAEIATLMGPTYVAFILKALRTALQRGYQLHVLSYTLHHILVKLSENGLKPGQLDYCLAEIVDVIMDDTFGVTGQEKDAEEYISKMKEVKSSKSFDSLDIIARSATPSHLVDLVLPIKSLLQEKLNAKMVQKTDELLRRIGLGVLQNPTVGNRDILVFCYELIQEVYKAGERLEKVKKEDSKNRRYLVNMKGAAKSGARLSTSSYIYKITRFGLDILRTVLRKHDELQTPQNLAGFLPIMGDAMVQGQEEVQISAVRLLTTIIKVPMVELDKNCPVYVLEAVRAIKGASSSNTELAQASLKLVSAVLRERPNVDVKDRDVGHLLKRVIPDLDVPDQQGVTFGFLKAVMNRHFDVPELYEAMDKVAEMMVTNQTKSARDVARSHYFQFLTEYAQTEKRFKKQIEFLLRNLRYEHIEGRQSVMDALDLVIAKALPRFPDKLQYDYQGMMFLPLVNTLANDDSSKCRELASLLIKRLFQHASDKRLQNFATDMKTWLEQDDNIGLKRLGIQCWGFYFEAKDEDEEDIPKELTYVLEQLQSIVQQGLGRRNEDDWELLYYSLTAFAKLYKSYSDDILSSDLESFWFAVQTSVGYPHAWVKLKSAELMGTYFAHLASANKEAGLASLPLEGSDGLQLAENDMIQLTDTFLRNLSNKEISEQLCTQSIKNVAFLARCFSVNEAKWKWQKAGEENEDDGEDHCVDENGDAEEDEEEWGGLSSSDETSKPKKNHVNSEPPAAIHRLMIRLSGLVRRESTPLPSKTAIMHLLETILAKFPLEPLTSSLLHLLTTLNTLTDPATTMPRLATTVDTDDPYKALIDKAREVMNTLQKRMGTQDYLKVMGEVQKNVRERRDERRRKRKVEAVTNPEKWGKEKKRRHDVARVKRKERSAENRGKRRGW